VRSLNVDDGRTTATLMDSAGDVVAHLALLDDADGRQLDAFRLVSGNFGLPLLVSRRGVDRVLLQCRPEAKALE
jgi:hypothetical protein